MIAKLKEKKLAIKLRKKGMSLQEIRQEVPVAKSTLSLWLKEVGLSIPQKQRLTQKKLDAAHRGALRRKKDRIAATDKIFAAAEKDIGSITKRELWLMGIMLYWAEGSKQKETNVASAVKLSNSDPFMIKFFVQWLNEICGVPLDFLRLDVYIHETSKKTRRELLRYWSLNTGVPLKYYRSIYFKKGSIKTKRKNIGDAYYGLVSLKVYRSTILNRQIAGWVKGIEKYYWGVV